MNPERHAYLVKELERIQNSDTITPQDQLNGELIMEILRIDKAIVIEAEHWSTTTQLKTGGIQHFKGEK